jgi:hypothetical protein
LLLEGKTIKSAEAEKAIWPLKTLVKEFRTLYT